MKKELLITFKPNLCFVCLLCVYLYRQTKKNTIMKKYRVRVESNIEGDKYYPQLFKWVDFLNFLTWVDLFPCDERIEEAGLISHNTFHLASPQKSMQDAEKIIERHIEQVVYDENKERSFRVKNIYFK